ncbi:hypothetical protein A2572_04550 [Candidatus Collierbacteria bacterium RIFOXYD1_FULL_40_9]|uniref:FAD:protein FMN transferase n=1 Tax=Candidatus Collierbacteria bacterium RIFOXYD1_FULL_40_9 TaxID=1817731 RepID=A0A1F5FPR5_9BACT|nr:MAG: hypothetical protein A2572_04550 [Candidatus Collierbacteria bacterium RIFOXYD1_FULL_40_9]
MNISFSATGTLWQIDIYDQNLPRNTNINQDIVDFVEDFESNFSRFRNTSFVTSLAKKEGTYSLPNTAKKLLDFYELLFDLTNGLFTPTITKSLVSAGYDKNYSLTPQKKLATPDDWKNITYNQNSITTTTPTQLDFGAAGKGYLIDLVCEFLTKMGVENFCVDAGGDIRLVGNKPLVIGLENPTDTSSVIGTINIQNSSFCGSSGNRRQWGKYNHLLNPKTLTSPKNILSTWVLSDECIIADGLATSLFFVEPNTLQKYLKFEYLILYSDFSIDKSDNLSVTLFN